MIREDPVSRYLLHAMGVLPTSFARLVFLTSMRDHYTGQYLHEGWASASSSEEVNTALGQMHRHVFEIVATLPLAGPLQGNPQAFRFAWRNRIANGKLLAGNRTVLRNDPRRIPAAGAQALYFSGAFGFGNTGEGSAVELPGDASLIATPTT